MLRSVDKVCRLYAIPREMILRRAEGSTNIYKQHVLQALMDAGYASEFGEVLQLYDSKMGIAYEKVDYPDIDTVMDAADAAEGYRGLGAPERIPQHGSFCASCAETTASAALKFITRATRRRIKRKCCA